jgi:hypothetical protein
MESQIMLDVPAGRVGAEFVRAFNVRLVEQTTASWEFYLGLLERFVDRERHARVPAQWREGGYRLGQWVDGQRQNYRRGILDPERRARLEAVSGWVWDARQAEWEDAFALLEKFVERERHARVPKEWEEDGFPLGQWVDVQRQAYQGKRHGTLDPERRARLEALPRWAWEPFKADWEEGFAHLRKFVEREEHARVPPRHREDGFRLGGWVAVQRQAYRRGTLGPERRARLEALPRWAWEPYKVDWEAGFAHLRDFVNRKGDAHVPRGYSDRVRVSWSDAMSVGG